MQSSKWMMSLPSPDHVGVLVKDVEQAVGHVSSLLNLGPAQRFELSHAMDSVSGGPVSFKVAFVKSGSVALEYIQQVEGKGMWGDFLEATGGGIHHIAYTVPNWDEVEAELEKQGCRKVAGLRLKLIVENGKVTAVHSDTGKRANFYDTGLSQLIVEIMEGKGVS